MMQADPLIRILSNIDTVCQGAISDFQSDKLKVNEEIFIKLNALRNCQQSKMGNRIADIAQNIIRSVSSGNVEFSSQVDNLIRSVANIVKYYDSLNQSSKETIDSPTNGVLTDITIDQYKNECDELKMKVSKLEAQSLVDKDTVLVLKAKCKQCDSLVQDNENLKFEITRFQDKLDRIEEASVTQLSAIKKAAVEATARNNELEEELSLAHKARHQYSVNAQNAINDFRGARQLQEAAEARAREMETSLRESTAVNKDLDLRLAQVTDQLHSACTTHSDYESRIQQLQSQLRGLDKAEAGMISAMQAKSFAESRMNRLEAENAAQSKAKDALQAALSSKEAEVKRLTLSKDLIGREMKVLAAEVATLSHIIGEKDAALAEKTMTVNSQHNQIVMCALERMDSATQLNAAAGEIAQLKGEIEGLHEAVARSQAEQEKVMGLLLAAQEKLLMVSNSANENFAAATESVTPPPTGNLFSRPPVSGSSRSNTPPRNSLFKIIPQRAMSILEERSVREKGAEPVSGSMVSDSDGLHKTYGSSNNLLRTANDDNLAVIEDLRRSLQEVTGAKHSCEMDLKALRAEMAEAREQLDSYQSRAELRKEYQELMKLRLRHRELETELRSVTSKYEALLAENKARDEAAAQSSASTMASKGTEVEASSELLAAAAVPPVGSAVLCEISESAGESVGSFEGVASPDLHSSSREECSELHESAVDPLPEVPSGSLSDAQEESVSAVSEHVVAETEQCPHAESLAEDGLDHTVTASSVSDVNVGEKLGSEETTTSAEASVDSVSFLVPQKQAAVHSFDAADSEGASQSESTGQVGVTVDGVGSLDSDAVSSESRSELSSPVDAVDLAVASPEPLKQQESRHTESISESNTTSTTAIAGPVMHQRRFVDDEHCPVLYLEINSSEVRLGFWNQDQLTLQPMFTCASHVAVALEGVDRGEVLECMQANCVESLDPSMCEFFLETGIMVGADAELCVTRPLHSSLPQLFELTPILDSDGHLTNPMGLCYVVLHCMLKGLGIEDLAEVQLLCSHPDAFDEADLRTLASLLMEDLCVGKACLVSTAQLTAQHDHGSVGSTSEWVAATDLLLQSVSGGGNGSQQPELCAEELFLLAEEP